VVNVSARLYPDRANEQASVFKYQQIVKSLDRCDLQKCQQKLRLLLDRLVHRSQDLPIPFRLHYLQRNAADSSEYLLSLQKIIETNVCRVFFVSDGVGRCG
jgi:hypothetical protein